MNTPFISRVEKVQEGVTIGSIVQKRTMGDVGLEIECEGNKLEKEHLPLVWEYHKDGSLRGKDNAEYVLKKPIKFAQVPSAVKDLWLMFDKSKTVLDLSNRTSVHVHLNVQKFHMNRLCSFLSMYFALEEILTAWCGDHRVGNLFCLRAKDAHSIITSVKRYIQNDGGFDLSDGFHYAGLNAAALQKFGSIEIRTLRGPTEPEPILDWVSILERIYTISNDFPDPRVIVQDFSGHDPMEFMDMILGAYATKVREEVDMTTEQIRDSLYDGIRLAQDLSYCRDWSIFSPFPEGDDPFRRDRPRKAKPVYTNQLTGNPGYDPWGEGQPGPGANQSAPENYPLPSTPVVVNNLHYQQQAATQVQAQHQLQALHEQMFTPDVGQTWAVNTGTAAMAANPAAEVPLAPIDDEWLTHFEQEFAAGVPDDDVDIEGN